MLIEVADNVLRKALAKSDNDHESAVEVLRHLSWSIRRNHHLVYFPSLDQNVINQLGSFLNSYEIKAFQLSFSKKRDLQRIKGLLKLYVVVSYAVETSRTNNVIYVRPDRTNRLNLFDKCFFLTENILDSEFYQYFAKAYQKLNRIDECVFRTNYYPLQGGGATIRQVYIMECNNGQHFCLAILDSDKKWPNFIGYGTTAEKFEEECQLYLRNNPEPLTCHYYVMQNTNEIENLIPIEVLSHYSSPAQKTVLANYPSILQWLDMKKGLEYKLLLNDDAFREWRNALPTVLNWARISAIKGTSVDEYEYMDKIRRAGLQEFVKPWGSSILDNVLHPDSKKKQKYDLNKIDLNRLLPAQRIEWDEIGALVFSWCCCFVRKIY